MGIGHHYILRPGHQKLLIGVFLSYPKINVLTQGHTHRVTQQRTHNNLPFCTDVPTPLWKKQNTDVPRTVNISNDYSVIVTCDGRSRTHGFPPKFRINYTFINFGGK